MESVVRMGEPGGRFGLPGTRVPDEPALAGLVLGDVTGDGLADVVVGSVQQLPPRLRLTASEDPATLSMPVEIASGAGVQLADIDADGHLDLVAAEGDQLFGLVAGAQPATRRDLGLRLSANSLGFATDPGEHGVRPARVYLADKVCP